MQPTYSFEVFGEISAQAIIHILLVNFVLYEIYQVFLTYFIYWIAPYPVDNTTHPLNKWGQM